MKLVKDFMHRDITSVSENSTLGQVIRVMKLHRMGAVPVVDSKGNYIGCITAEVVLNIALPDYMKSMYDTSFMASFDQVTEHLKEHLNDKVSLFISKKCIHLNPNDSMSYAADLLYKNKRTILPVIEENIQVGWISKVDIISMALRKEDEEKPLT
jgi:predicted transcriptional regulator